MDRWATFDCYGTLIDWPGGIGDGLERLFGADRRDDLLERYFALEPEAQRDGALPYREVMARTLAAVAAEAGLAVPDGEEDALGRSLPWWPAFGEVPAALEEARARGWKLAILSNTDRDLIEASMQQIGVPFELAIVASEIGSYKPAHGHWQAFYAQTGADPAGHVHVAQSLFHDVAPCVELGIPSVWIDRRGEGPDPRPARTLTRLTGLADELDSLVAL